MAEHRVPMLSASLRRLEDPARSRDPRIRELVAALGAVAPAPAPRPHFRAELRAQLVAVTPRLVAEGDATRDGLASSENRAAAQSALVRAGDSRSVNTSVADARRRRALLLRPLTAVACTVVTLTLLLAGAVWLSRDALPGSSLYDIKRASESLQQAMTSGQTSRADLALSFAGTRINEVHDLLPRSATTSSSGQISSHTAALVTSTLNSADADVRSAAQTLGAEAARNGSAAPLGVMAKWAPPQLEKLAKIIDALPAGKVRTRAEQSYSLLSEALARATTLQAEAGCGCLKSARSDDLGPIPCPVCASSTNPGVSGTAHLPAPAAGTKAATAGSPAHHGSASTASGRVSGSGSVTGATAAPSTGSAPSSSTSSTHTLPGATLPTVSLPVGTDSCGLTAGIGPIHVGLGTCGVSVGIGNH